MSINKNDLRSLIESVLLDVGLYSESAVELLMLTAAVESHGGTYLRQIGGPALGIFQMEPATHDDIWVNYLKWRFPDHTARIYKYLVEPDDARLEYDLAYAIVMARLHYLRVKEPLPEMDPNLRVDDFAAYWKEHYNTHSGAGTVKKAVGAYQRYAS